MDPLSSMLRAVRLTGAVFFEIKASEPWVAATPAGASIVDSVLPGSQHLIPYHMLTFGNAWAWTREERPVHLRAGDVVVFPQGDPHVVSSAPGMLSDPDMSIYRRSPEQRLPFHMRVGETATAPCAHLICGYLGCEARPFNPLLEALPRIIQTSSRESGTLAMIIEMARTEATQSRAGGESVLARLSELMFVEIVRRYLETLPGDRANWLSGLRDPVVGPALAALHRNPTHAWTLNSLAEDVGISRSRLAERFVRLVGQSPIQYLLRWRMHLAANRLREGFDTVAAIGQDSGYESEAAFSRAFKKIIGVSPGQWRRGATPSKCRPSPC